MFMLWLWNLKAPLMAFFSCCFSFDQLVFEIVQAPDNSCNGCITKLI